MGGALFGIGTPATPADRPARERFTLARAADALPAGSWRIKAAPENYDLAHGALGWLFAEYRFDRYKKGEPPRARLVCPPGVDADLVLAQAAGVLATVRREGIERKGGTWSAEDEAEFKRPTIEMFDRQSHPLYASARLWDDGIILPFSERGPSAASSARSAPLSRTSARPSAPPTTARNMATGPGR